MKNAISNPKGIQLDSLLYRVIGTPLKGSNRTHCNLEILLVGSVVKMQNGTGRIVGGDLVREDNQAKLPGSEPQNDIAIHYDQTGRAYGMEVWTDDKDLALSLLDKKLRGALALANSEKAEIENYIAIVQGSIDAAFKSSGGFAKVIEIGEDGESFDSTSTYHVD
jgi:uncharacterized protein YuzE